MNNSVLRIFKPKWEVYLLPVLEGTLAMGLWWTRISSNILPESKSLLNRSNDCDTVRKKTAKVHRWADTVTPDSLRLPRKGCKQPGTPAPNNGPGRQVLGLPWLRSCVPRKQTSLSTPTWGQHAQQHSAPSWPPPFPRRQGAPWGGWDQEGEPQVLICMPNIPCELLVLSLTETDVQTAVSSTPQPLLG